MTLITLALTHVIFVVTIAMLSCLIQQINRPLSFRYTGNGRTSLKLISPRCEDGVVVVFVLAFVLALALVLFLFLFLFLFLVLFLFLFLVLVLV